MLPLLLTLFFCHWLADYTPLSDARMLAAKRFGRPFTPILVHGMMHGTLMAIALLVFGVEAERVVWLYLLQCWSHALIDTAKGRLNARFAVLQSPANVQHWVVFGLDQYAHAAVILLMAHYSGLPL